jgi:hypothetical protein
VGRDYDGAHAATRGPAADCGAHVSPGTVHGVQRLGKAVQVNPIKITLKAPGSERLKLRCDEMLSNFAFRFNLRCYTWEAQCDAARVHRSKLRRVAMKWSEQRVAGAFAGWLSAIAQRRLASQGRAVQVEPIKALFKPPGTKCLKLE